MKRFFQVAVPRVRPFAPILGSYRCGNQVETVLRRQCTTHAKHEVIVMPDLMDAQVNDDALWNVYVAVSWFLH
jgi:hypothetical protein